MSSTTTQDLGLVVGQSSDEPWGDGDVIGDNFKKVAVQFRRVFNVVGYGAKGDGTTDDTTAIQDALNDAAAVGGIVVIPAGGDYPIAQSTRLTVKSDVIISAYGARIFKAGVPTNGILANFVAGTDSFTAYNGNSRIRIYGGIWDGMAQNAATDAAYDILDFNHCRDIIVRDATIRNVCTDHGLEFNSTDGGQVINCRFEGFRDATSGSTRQFSEAFQIDVAVSGSATIGSFDGTHSKNILMQGCYAGPAVDGSGLGSFGKLVGSHTTASGQSYKNIQIIGNIVDGALDVGIGAYNWVDSIIANNVIYNTTSHGIRVTGPDPAVVGFNWVSAGVIVRGNTIDTTSGTATGIEVLGYTSSAYVTDCIIEGNTIRNAAGVGIFCQFSQNQLVIGNLVDTPGSNGINVSASQYPLITGNWVSKPASNYCITVGQSGSTSTTDGQISDNICLLGTAATAGVRLSTGTDKFLVSGNTVRKAGGSQTVAIKCAGTAGTAVTVDGNDCTGFGDLTTTITNDSTGTVNKSFPSTTNIGRNLA